MTSKISIFDQKYAHFGSFDGSVLTILGAKKSLSGLFQSCFGVVYGVFEKLFLTIKGPLLVLFSTPKVDK